MIDIELQNGKTGYDAVEEYIKRYWEHNSEGDVVISLGASYDGISYDLSKEVASPMQFRDVEFLNDWWEGQKYIRLFGIKAVDKMDISGGIYL